MRRSEKQTAVIGIVICLAVCMVCGLLAFTTRAESPDMFSFGGPEVNLDIGGNNGEGQTATEQVLFPGHTYEQKPIVTIDKNSTDCYVSMMVEIRNMESLRAAFPPAKFPDFYEDDVFLLEKWYVDATGRSTLNTDQWEFEKFHTDGEFKNNYEFRYCQVVNGEDGELPPLFTDFTVPGALDAEGLNHLGKVEFAITICASPADAVFQHQNS